VGLALSARTRVTQSDKTRNLVHTEIHWFDAHLRVPHIFGLLCTMGPYHGSLFTLPKEGVWFPSRPPPTHASLNKAHLPQGEVQRSLRAPTGGHVLSGDEWKRDLSPWTSHPPSNCQLTSLEEHHRPGQPGMLLPFPRGEHTLVLADRSRGLQTCSGSARSRGVEEWQ